MYMQWSVNAETVRGEGDEPYLELWRQFKLGFNDFNFKIFDELLNINQII
jgi:hypothetical protein